MEQNRAKMSTTVATEKFRLITTKNSEDQKEGSIQANVRMDHRIDSITASSESSLQLITPKYC